MASSQTTPEVLWAQRSSSTDAEKNVIFLTISAPDVAKIDVDLKPTSLTFTGHSETKKTTYHVELEFYAEIDVENSKTNHTSRDVEFVLRKKELKDEYWPRLLKESKKVHFLKTDFDKWVDEDEQNAPIDDLSSMGGMGEDGGYNGLDFSKLGGAGGLGDMGDLPDMGADDDEDDDEELPDLEEDNAADKPETTAEVKNDEPEPATTSSKIQEVS